MNAVFTEKLNAETSLPILPRTVSSTLYVSPNEAGASRA